MDDNVAALDGWQTGDVSSSWHENIKPLVSSGRYKRQPETRLWSLLIGV